MSGLVSLSPPIKSLSVENSFLVRMLRGNSALFFMLLGNRSCLERLTLWREVLSPSMFSKVVRVSLKFLFNWSTKNISYDRQVQFYQSIYSSTSTKVLRHLYQTMESDGTFGTYKKKKRSWFSTFLGHSPVDPFKQYDILSISCPIGVIVGNCFILLFLSLVIIFKKCITRLI